MRTEKIFLLRCLGEDLELVFQTRGLLFRYERSRLTGEGTLPLGEYQLPLIVSIDQVGSILTMTLGLPVEFPASGETDAAMALAQLNSRITAGCFRIRDGLVSFRVTSFFRDCRLSLPAISSMVDFCAASEAYLVPLRRLATGEITLEQFLEKMA